MCIYVCIVQVCMHTGVFFFHIWVWMPVEIRGIGFPRARIIGNCEIRNVGTGN